MKTMFRLGLSAAALAAAATLATPGFAADVKDCVFGVLPKQVGNEYWAAVNKGAQEAGKELGVKVDFNGPTSADTAGQTQFIDSWVQKSYCAISISAADANAVVPALLRAKDAGIKVSAFDADTDPSAREVFLSQAIPSGIAGKLGDLMADLTGKKGNFLVITSTLTAPNQSEWIRLLQEHLAKNYPDMKIASILPGQEDNEKSRDVALGYLRAHPETTGIIAVTQSLPGLAEAKKQLGLTIPLIGIGPPSCCTAVLADGSANATILWNPIDIGYATVYMQYAQVTDALKLGKGNTIDAGRLGKLTFIADDTILLGEPMVFTKDNMGQFQF
jgi:ABC-type sugar transport system substrate-binding protein